MIRTPPTLALVAALLLGVGCPAPGGTGDSAMIEITGYLDAGEVQVTAKSQPNADTPVGVTVLGLPGAALEPGTVSVTLERTGDSVSAPATDDGAFVLDGLEVLLGDVLALGHSEAGDDTLEVVTESLADFPAVEDVSWGEWHGHEILLTLLFSEPLPDGTILVATNLDDHDVGQLEAIGDREHQGWILAQPGHWILLYAVDTDHHATLAYEVQAPAEGES